MIANGNTFRLRLNANNLVGETQSGIAYSANLVSVTKGISNGFEEVIPGVASASITFNRLYTGDETLTVGQKLPFHIGPRTQGLAGECIIENISIDSASDEVVTYAGTAKVTGPITDFIPVFALDKLIDNNDNQIVTDTGDRLCVITQTN